MYSVYIFQGNERFPSSHAVALCELPNGDLLSAWYSGTTESAPDSVILGSRLPGGSKVWLEPVVLVDVANRAAGNPRIFMGPDGVVWLIAPINYGHWCDGGTRLFFKRSYDQGQSWTDLEIFTTRRRILGKNKPLHIAESDLWILPMEYEGLGDVAFMISSNRGRSWKIVDRTGEGAYLDQPTVVQLGSGEILAYLRSWEGYIYETRSSDLGESWSKPIPTQLKNPNSGIDMIRTRSGKIILAYNPVSLGPKGDLTTDTTIKDREQVQNARVALRYAGDYELNRMIHKIQATKNVHEGGYLTWGPRYPLVLGVSRDEGRTWKDKVVLESQPGEYSYPAIIQTSDGVIHLAYTYQRKAIKYVRIEEQELD
jgi:predicted neuraminidase